MADVKDFVPGQIVLLSSGSYSDYGVNSVVRVLQPFTNDDVRRLAKAKALTIDEWVGFPIALVLVEAGLVEEVENRELHEDDWGHDKDDWTWQDTMLNRYKRYEAEQAEREAETQRQKVVYAGPPGTHVRVTSVWGDD